MGFQKFLLFIVRSTCSEVLLSQVATMSDHSTNVRHQQFGSAVSTFLDFGPRNLGPMRNECICFIYVTCEQAQAEQHLTDQFFLQAQYLHHYSLILISHRRLEREYYDPWYTSLQLSWVPAQQDPDISQDPRFSVVLTSPSVSTAFSEVCIRAAA